MSPVTSRDPLAPTRVPNSARIAVVVAVDLAAHRGLAAPRVAER